MGESVPEIIRFEWLGGHTFKHVLYALVEEMRLVNQGGIAEREQVFHEPVCTHRLLITFRVQETFQHFDHVTLQTDTQSLNRKSKLNEQLYKEYKIDRKEFF